MSDFVRARNRALDAEAVVAASALPYLAGWEAVPDEPSLDAPVAAPADQPALDESAAEPAAASVTPGSTSVGRPTRMSKES